MNTKTAKNNRRKGHNFERELVNSLKDIGFDCSTSRYSSRESDDKCIDIFFHDKTPLAIQCKCTANNFPNPVKEISKIQSTDYRVLAVKLINRGKYVVLEEKDFLELLEMLRSNKIF